MLIKMIDITEIVDNIGLISELHCFACKSLLSVPPILLDAEGNNFCGRCVPNLNTDAFVHNVYYENLASQFIFPCSFLAEGCYVKKKFNEIRFHEQKCPYQIIKCPVKTCIWSGITTELIIHFDLNHEGLKIANDDAKKLLESDGCFMLTADGFNFLITWIYQESNLKLEVNGLHFIDSDDDVKIICTITAANSKKPIKISSNVRLKTGTTFNLHDFPNKPLSTSLLFSIHVVLPADIISNRLKNLGKIKCPGCLLQMVPPILKCPKEHTTCLECTRADYDFCSQCVEDELHFTRMRDLELLTVSSLYTCKWEDCGGYFSFRQIREHEQSCSKRTFMCMHCFQWYGFWNEISSHDAECLSKKCLCPLIKGNSVTILGTETGMQEYLLLAFREIFWIICKPTENGINISVSNYGPVSSLDWYCYEVDLQHNDDSNFPFNKTFCIKNKAYNEFTADVPISDVARFGGSEFYKITVRIILLNNDDRSKTIAVNFRRFN